jgi:hypothetical protein
MKISAVLGVCLTLGSIGANAQNAPAGATKASGVQAASAAKAGMAAQAKIDPAKEADIRKLLELAGTKALVSQTMESMSKSIKPLLTNSLPPGDYREKLVDLFFAKFTAKADVQHLLDLAVPGVRQEFLPPGNSQLDRVLPDSARPESDRHAAQGNRGNAGTRPQMG